MSIWQMAVAPCNHHPEPGSQNVGNGFLSSNVNGDGYHESSESEDDSDSVELHEQSVVENTRVALACDDGCVRIYTILEDELVYTKSLPRVSGEISTPRCHACLKKFHLFVLLMVLIALGDDNDSM